MALRGWCLFVPTENLVFRVCLLSSKVVKLPKTNAQADKIDSGLPSTLVEFFVALEHEACEGEFLDNETSDTVWMIVCESGDVPITTK